MSEKIVQLNEEVIKGQLKELVRGSVEETLNELLEAEAEKLTQAARYERNEQRQGYRSGHYNRNLTTTSGDVTLKVPKLKGIPFETAIIERYRSWMRSRPESPRSSTAFRRHSSWRFRNTASSTGRLTQSEQNSTVSNSLLLRCLLSCLSCACSRFRSCSRKSATSFGTDTCWPL